VLEAQPGRIPILRFRCLRRMVTKIRRTPRASSWCSTMAPEAGRHERIRLEEYKRFRSVIQSFPAGCLRAAEEMGQADSRSLRDYPQAEGVLSSRIDAEERLP